MEMKDVKHNNAMVGYSGPHCWVVLELSMHVWGSPREPPLNIVNMCDILKFPYYIHLALCQPNVVQRHYTDLSNDAMDRMCVLL